MFVKYGLLTACVLQLALSSGCGGSTAPVKSASSQATSVTLHRVAHTTNTAPAEGEATWPFWRGPHRDGISLETGWETEWKMPPPGVLWRTNIGTGYSSVSVAQGRLLTMGHPRRGENETIWCLNPETGQELWSVTYPCTLLDHLHKGGPGATPTIDGDYVYANSREGEIRKLKVETGEVVWIFDLRKELRLNLPEWGFTCSPLLFEDEILIEAGSVIGINKQTGKLAWKTTPRMPGYGTPELFEFEQKPYLAALNNEGVSVVDLTSHEEVSFFAWDSPYNTNSTTPIWQDGKLFISSGYNIGCVLLNFDGVSLSPEWQNKNMRNHMNSCILKGGYLYGVDGNSHIRRTVTFNCLDWESGDLLWSQPGMGCGAVSAVNNHLLIMSDDGELILAEMTPKAYREQGRVRVMNEQCWTVPVLCNNLIYCRGADGTLACVDVRTDEVD